MFDIYDVVKLLAYERSAFTVSRIKVLLTHTCPYSHGYGIWACRRNVHRMQVRLVSPVQINGRVIRTANTELAVSNLCCSNLCFVV